MTAGPRGDDDDRVSGAVARRVRTRFPDVDLLEAFDAPLDFGVPFGHAQVVELEDGAPFRAVVMLAPPNHREAPRDPLRRRAGGRGVANAPTAPPRCRSPR